MYIMPPFELAFIIAATVLSGLLFVMWKKSNLLNTIFKTVFFFLTIWGILILYDQRLF